MFEETETPPRPVKWKRGYKQLL